MWGKSLFNEKAIIILSLNQSECRKLLRSASSRIGFSLDTRMEESACKSSCLPLLLAIRKRSSKDLFSLVFSSKDYCDAHHENDAFYLFFEFSSNTLHKSIK